MRIVKYYAWEKPFLSKIRDARKRELGKIRLLSAARAFLFFFIYAAPPLSLGMQLDTTTRVHFDVHLPMPYYAQS